MVAIINRQIRGIGDGNLLSLEGERRVHAAVGFGAWFHALSVSERHRQAGNEAEDHARTSKAHEIRRGRRRSTPPPDRTSNRPRGRLVVVRRRYLRFVDFGVADETKRHLVIGPRAIADEASRVEALANTPLRRVVVPEVDVDACPLPGAASAPCICRSPASPGRIGERPGGALHAHPVEGGVPCGDSADVGVWPECEHIGVLIEDTRRTDTVV